MTERIHVRQVGAPDPEAKNSPIFDPAAEWDAEAYDRELEAGVCFFNGAAYNIGDYVCSGDELLRCEERGVWIREGVCEAK
jgi:hypothetical protein